MYEQQLKQIMLRDPRTMTDLMMVRSIGLPDWYIAAGYVRNQVWDYLHNRDISTDFNDVDIIYFDRQDCSEETEKKVEEQLRHLDPSQNWSVKNQARMHIRNNSAPYADAVDAMSRWPETATAVGITLSDSGIMEVAAPHGLDDLFQMVVRQSPYFHVRPLFMHRIKEKRWLERWEQLRIAGYPEQYE